MKNAWHGTFLSAALVASLLAGCQSPNEPRPLTSEVPPPPSFTPPPEACLAEGARFALGLIITAPLLEEMRQRTGARFARTVGVNDPADPQQDPTRLNVRVEPNGRVIGASCQ